MTSPAVDARATVAESGAATAAARRRPFPRLPYDVLSLIAETIVVLYRATAVDFDHSADGGTLIRCLRLGDFKPARHIWSLVVKPDSDRAIPTAEVLSPLFDHCSQLSMLVPLADPRAMTSILEAFSASQRASSIKILDMHYRIDSSIDGFDPHDFRLVALLHGLTELKVDITAADDRDVVAVTRLGLVEIPFHPTQVFVYVLRSHSVETLQEEIGISVNLSAVAHERSSALLLSFAPRIGATLSPYMDVGRSLVSLTVTSRFMYTAFAAYLIAGSLGELASLRALTIAAANSRTREALMMIEKPLVYRLLDLFPTWIELVKLDVVFVPEDEERMDEFRQGQLGSRLKSIKWLVLYAQTPGRNLLLPRFSRSTATKVFDTHGTPSWEREESECYDFED
ncbi:hypothetical protein JCM10212_005737 [Sporobolomyces blumeae]